MSLSTIEFLPEEKRNCRFRFENENMKVFKEYTQKRCTFECQLQLAGEICKCIPWNYPHTSDGQLVCDYMGVWCFNKVMSEPSTQEKCQCPNDCSVNRYSKS